MPPQNFDVRTPPPHSDSINNKRKRERSKSMTSTPRSHQTGNNTSSEARNNGSPMPEVSEIYHCMYQYMHMHLKIIPMMVSILLLQTNTI